METNPNCRDKDEGEDIECDEGEFKNEAGWKETDEGDEGDEGQEFNPAVGLQKEGARTSSMKGSAEVPCPQVF
ncbi:unnamed protein product [Aspergillus oryzae]|nr:unnamed protein product [Aspergillus oryzae]GMF83451.1 unnamed protein product [Aspergillus oryzae]